MNLNQGATMPSRPRIGDIVHYRSYGTPGGEYTPECRAAIVTGFPDSDPALRMLDLCVVNPTGIFFNQVGVAEEDEPETGGRWHYACAGREW